MRSCQEVARLMSLSQEQKLSLGQRIELKFHMMMCGPCKDFNSNLNTIRKALTGFNQQDKGDHK